MRGNILATLPQDLGKKIRFSWSMSPMVVEAEQPCDCCGSNIATCVVQGETDSFGFETVYCCEACSKPVVDDGADIEDREPAEGHLFVVNEGYNHDDGGHGFFATFKSYREAQLFYRECETRAESRCGLYPDSGVQEWPQERVDRTKRDMDRAIRQEMADMDEFDAQAASEYDYDDEYDY